MTADDISACVEQELEAILDPRAVTQIRELLVEPRRVQSPMPDAPVFWVVLDLPDGSGPLIFAEQVIQDSLWLPTLGELWQRFGRHRFEDYQKRRAGREQDLGHLEELPSLLADTLNHPDANTVQDQPTLTGIAQALAEEMCMTFGFSDDLVAALKAHFGRRRREVEEMLEQARRGQVLEEEQFHRVLSDFRLPPFRNVTEFNP